MLWYLTRMADEQPWVWMGTPAVAKYLGVSHRTVYKLIDEGDIPGFQLGRVIRCRQHELDEYLERSRIAKGDLAARHQDQAKGAWKWTSTELKEARARLEAFVATYQAGDSGPCPVCGAEVGPADIAAHLLGHASGP